MTARTGPKISSCAMRAVGATSAKTVGATLKPLVGVSTAVPPVIRRPSTLAEGDVVEDALFGDLVDDRAGLEVVGRGAVGEGFDALFEAVEEGVVDGLGDDDAGAGGALLAVEAEGGGGDAVDGGVEVGIGVDDDGVLATELEDGALDEVLAGLGFGCALVDLEADFLGAGEGDETNLRVLDDGAADLRAALDEVDDAVGEAGFFHQRQEAGGDGGSVGRGLEDDGVAADDGRSGHAGHDGEREVPGRNDGADAEGDVAEEIFFAGVLDGGGGSVEAEGFAGVELEEVDGLAYVGVGLGVVLADFEGEPGAEVEVALADEVGGADEQGNAVGDGGVAPGGEGGLRGSDGGVGFLGRGRVVRADDLRRVGGIDGVEGLGGLEIAAGDDKVVGLAELGAGAVEGGVHGALVLGGGEVGEGLVAEGGQGGGSHPSSLCEVLRGRREASRGAARNCG